MNENEWIEIQQTLKKKITYENKVNLDKLKKVAGVDISFDNNDINKGCVYITIMDYNSLKIIYEDYELIDLDVPYIPGFLGFREIPHYMNLLNRVPEIFKPDIILVDGFGKLHHIEFGSVSHLGVLSKIPTIGIGKKLLMIDGINEKDIKSQLKQSWNNNKKYISIIGKSGINYGVAFSINNGNPIYITIGNAIDINTSIEIIKHLCLYRIPEPIRISDINSKKYF